MEPPTNAIDVYQMLAGDLPEIDDAAFGRYLAQVVHHVRYQRWQEGDWDWPEWPQIRPLGTRQPQARRYSAPRDP